MKKSKIKLPTNAVLNLGFWRNDKTQKYGKEL